MNTPFTIRVGDVEITSIEDYDAPVALGTVDLTLARFVPDVAADTWRRHQAAAWPDHLEPAERPARVAVRSWLLRSQGRTILVDTSIGGGKDRPAVPAWHHRPCGGFLANLEEAGVRPEDLDLVVNTHLHVDHVGGNTREEDGQWIPTFVHASYLLPAPDVAHFDPAANPRFLEGTNQNVFEDSIAPVQAAGQVELWENERTIDAALSLHAAPGHTPGSSVLTVRSGGETALVAGDLLHHPVQISAPGCNSCFCENPVAARLTRRRWLAWAAEHRALVLPTHFSGQAAVRIDRDGDAYRIARDA